MSGYKKNYTWTKANLNPSTYSGGSSSSKIESSIKYGPVYSRPTADTKTSSERSSGLRLGQKYGSYSSAHFCDPAHSKNADKYGGTAVTVRLKETDKREISQPPISYRPVARAGTQSRDPSMERDTTDRLSTLSIHNCNSLYPPSIHTRSASHDRSNESTPSSTIPKYTGRSSITKTDKYGLTRASKEDLATSKYKPLSRATSREDLDSGPKKYITSRFLPKNTIEKSNTAYTRPSSTRISSTQRDTSRKNREILNLLSSQTDSSKTSRSASRSSNISESTRSGTEKTSTSSHSTSTGVTKSETATSDNTSIDSTKSKISNISATPWSSYLDLKFSSPKSSKTSSQNQLKQTSSNSKLSTSNSSKNTSARPDSKSKLTKNTSHNSGKLILNKDFRKSILNMNPEIKCHHNGSVSPAESETEFPLSEATDVSENLSSCVSYHKQSSSSGSKLPKRSIAESVDRRSARSNTRSPSIPSEGHSNSTTATSGSEDDIKTKSNSKAELKQSKSFLSSRSALLNEHGDGSDKSPKPPMSPRLKSEGDAKSLLMRSLTPVAFKLKHQDSDHRINWMDSTDKETSNANSSKISKSIKDETKSDNANKMKHMRRVESGERAWWLDGTVTPPDGVQVCAENTSDKSHEQESYKDYFQKYRIRHIDSGEKAWWLNSNENISESVKSLKSDPKYKISHQASGEKAWWLQTPPKSHPHSSETSESDLEDSHDLPLGDRASPEGLEMPKEVEEQVVYLKAKKPSGLFISKHKNIDDILGGTSQCLSPLMEQIFNYRERKQSVEECQEVQPNQVKIHDSTAQRGVIHPNRLDNVGVISSSSSQADRLDDASLQLYKDGDYGSYLDLEASISEQHEEFEGFQLNKKNSIVLRTQLSVRVHSIIDKLLNSEGRELRRALFSLKQIFQEDKDLVHEFVQNDGLACLIKVGSEADQNYQNYILRALGQVMLYVDGMNGVIQHNETVQWLYSLISSKFRLVVKTALKLLLVFVEYVDTNCLLLIKAVQNADCSQGLLSWHNIMKLLKDFDSADTELLIYAMTLINKCFNGIPDQDTYYDQTDALEEQGIEGIIQRYMSKPGTDLDLLQQFQVYEAVLQYEDAEEKGIPLRNLDENLRKTLKSRKSVMGVERRKSRRHSTGTSPLHASLNLRNNLTLQVNAEGDDESSSSQSSSGPNEMHLNGSYKENNKASEAGVTPALRRRRERAERQRSFMREQQESAAIFREPVPTETNSETLNGNYINSQHSKIPNGKLLNRTSSRKDITPLRNAVNKLDSDESNLTKQPWILSMMYGNKTVDDENQENIEDTNENDRKMLMNRENTVKDLTQKLANQTIINNNFEENKINRIGDMSGLISKAKEGLAKSKSKIDVLKSPTNENLPKIEVKKSENELRWEELEKSLNRTLHLCDMDFTDLRSDDEIDVLAPAAASNGIPPPPPPLLGGMLAPPPPPLNNNNINNKTTVPNPPVFGVNLQRVSKPIESKLPIKKNKKTVKLFWKEVRDDAIAAMKLKTGLIWDELAPVNVDTQKLEHLFESRAKDLITKEKQQELNKNKEIIVLDPKRSNAINIGMTKLPPPRSIKTAILKMDATVMNREGIEKLLTMLPTEEERTKIQEAQAANPDLPLGSAEQFLLTLASISELPARLNLWAFKLDFESSEREIAEPLMDLKQGFEVLKLNKTFRGILGTLLSIGIFLNGAEVKGFQIEYLAKVPEVKDTVHKHSLLHHLCHIVMEKFPDASDLYSEIGAITRASKVDFDELALNIQRLETDCKASWDHLKLIAKHDGSTMMKVKMSDFLTDCAERIILLGIVHRRVMNRFHRFLLWLGIPLHQISDTKPNEFCRIISEFALEYRTTRERVLQQLEKKANHRERNKTRGKMITEIGKFRTKEDRADAELRQLLGSDMSEAENLQGTFTWRRRSRDTNRSFLSQGNGNLTDGDDEILESLVKTATKGPSRTAPRERKRTRHADRKSLKRSRTRENNPFGSRDSP